MTGSWAAVIVVLGLRALISGAWMWSHYLKARAEVQREETKRHRDETWLMTQVRLSPRRDQEGGSHGRPRQNEVGRPGGSFAPPHPALKAKEPPWHNSPPLKGPKALETMGNWATVIVVLGLGALISGAWMWGHYLKARVEVQREETKRHRDETWLMTQVRLSPRRDQEGGSHGRPRQNEVGRPGGSLPPSHPAPRTKEPSWHNSPPLNGPMPPGTPSLAAPRSGRDATPTMLFLCRPLCRVLVRYPQSPLRAGL